MTRSKISFYISLIFMSVTTQGEAVEQELSKPLLRVWPAFRIEECQDWAILPFICKQCLSMGKQYAQKIYFYENGPYRIHGCYLEPKGFEPIEEQK